MSNHHESPRLLSPALSKVMGYKPLIDLAQLPGNGRRIVDRHSSFNLILLGNEQFVVVDGGWDPSAKRLERFVKHQGLALKNCIASFTTHAHVDHLGLLSVIANNKSTKIYISEAENEVLQGRAPVSGSVSKLIEKMPGIPSVVMPGLDTEILSDGDVVKFDRLEVHAMALPGHTRGSSGYLFSNARDGSEVLYSGDAVDFMTNGKVRIAPGLLNDDDATNWQTIIDLPSRLISMHRDHAEIVPAHSGNSNVEALSRAVASRMILESEIRTL